MSQTAVASKEEAIRQFLMLTHVRDIDNSTFYAGSHESFAEIDKLLASKREGGESSIPLDEVLEQLDECRLSVLELAGGLQVIAQKRVDSEDIVSGHQAIIYPHHFVDANEVNLRLKLRSGNANLRSDHIFSSQSLDGLPDRLRNHPMFLDISSVLPKEVGEYLLDSFEPNTTTAKTELGCFYGGLDRSYTARMSATTESLDFFRIKYECRQNGNKVSVKISIDHNEGENDKPYTCKASVSSGEKSIRFLHEEPWDPNINWNTRLSGEALRRAAALADHNGYDVNARQVMACEVFDKYGIGGTHLSTLDTIYNMLDAFKNQGELNLPNFEVLGNPDAVAALYTPEANNE